MLKSVIFAALCCTVTMSSTNAFFEANCPPNQEEETDESSSDQKTEINGIQVIYNNSCIDGGITVSASETNQTYTGKMTVSNSIPKDKTISIPFETQQTNYYCGPAAAKMVLGGIGITVSQSQIAAKLGTTTSGTGAGDTVADALNSYASGTGFKFRWQWHYSRDIETIKNHVIEAISFGNPVMVNTVEPVGETYFAGHDQFSTTLYHFGVVADYFNYGSEVTYTDPGFGRYPGFKQDQRVTIKDLSYACGERGYAW